MNPPEQIEYKGVVYKRNPDSPEWPKRVYYQASRGSGRGYLHRDIYTDTNGPIPSGMHVHHVDYDPFNNKPENLVALTPADHQRLHRELNGKFDEERMAVHMATTIKAAAAWHGSEAGIAWHREQGRRSWENRETDTFTCPECGTEHEGYFPERSESGRYCSHRCRHRGDKRAGKYREEATCPICSEMFMRMKYRKRAETCSRACGRVLMSRRIAERKLATKNAEPGG